MIAAGSFAHGDDAADASGPLHELPSPDTRRWVVRRKAVVVQAVRNGTITLQEACRRYNLSVEEFLAWQRAIERYGIPGPAGDPAADLPRHRRGARGEIAGSGAPARRGNRRPGRGCHPGATRAYPIARRCDSKRAHARAARAPAAMPVGDRLTVGQRTLTPPV